MHKKSIFFILLLALVFGGFVFFSGKKTPDKTAPNISIAADAVGLPDATPTQTIDLRNGDTYELTVGYVANVINGKKIKMLAYGGSIPGPVLRVRQGDSVTIRLKNNSDLETLLHSHGVRMENKFDGTHLVQKDILPGESFDYQLNFPDVGLMWYHPHVREDKQQAMGLYGSMLITPKDTSYWAKADHEKVLFLSDILLEGGDIAVYDDTLVTHALMGRFGNTLMINGETDFTMTAEPGEVQRYYVANASAVRPFNFQIPGARMKLVGGDNGRYERETFVNSITLHPSERFIVEVLFSKSGDYAIEHAYPEKTYRLGTVKVSGDASVGNASSFEILRTDIPLISEFNDIRKKYLTAEPDKTVNLTVNTDMNAIMGNAMGGGGSMEGMSTGGGHGGGDTMAMGGGGHGGGNTTATGSMMMSGGAPIEWEDNMGSMNVFAIAGNSPKANTTWIIEDANTKKQNEEVVWKFKRNVPVKIRIFNDPKSAHPMQHPIHFHGNRFTVLSRDGVSESNMVWKDTAVVRAGESIDILLETTNPGKWMAHCHISEHFGAGMTKPFDIE